MLGYIKQANSVQSVNRDYPREDKKTELRMYLLDDTFHDFRIYGPILKDIARPQDKDYVRIGSWSGNYWFHVTASKTVKQVLANAKKHLRAIGYIIDRFEYISVP